MAPTHRCLLALDEIDRQLDSGRSIDHASLLNAYSDVADELAPHLAVIGQLLELGGESRPEGDAQAVPGRSIGHYELLEQIGRGAMGVVFKARQQGLDRIVALKLHHAGPFADEQDIERFRQEARALAQLDHPCIVTVYEAGEADGRTYLSMQYVPGTNLAQQLRDNPPTIPQAVEAVRDVASAIAYAHCCGVVHRDLKPANILIDDTGSIRIADFGLGKVLSGDHGLTQTGQVLGTLRYMAPEQFEGAATAPCAGDIYSIGAILYELLSGRPPFWSQSTIGLVRQIQEQDPLPLRQLDRRIPRDLETICLKCLSKSPAQRYATAADLAADLDRYLRGEPVLARPLGASLKLWRYCRRRPITTAIAATSIITILAAVIVSTYFGIAASRGHRDAIVARQAAERNARAALEQRELARRELDRSEAIAYAGQIDHALHEWRAGDTIAAMHALTGTRQDLRGWEYAFLKTSFTDKQFTLTGHQRHVMSVCFSPDSRRLASGSWDTTIKIWDVKRREEIRTLTGHAEHVESVDFSPDGRRLVSGSRDLTARIWDVDSGRELLKFSGHNGFVVSVKFSVDGRQIISGGRDNVIRVWDAESGKEVRTLHGHTAYITCLDVHPNGRWIASGARDDTIRLWDVDTGAALAVLSTEFGHVEGVAFSPDGQTVAGAYRHNRAILWRLTADGRSAVPLSLHGHQNGVNDVEFVPNGLFLVSGSYDQSLGIWEVKDPGWFRRLQGHTRAVFCVAASPDTKWIASGGEDRNVKLWSTAAEQAPVTFHKHTDWVLCAEFSPDGRQIVSGSRDSGLLWWDIPNSEIRRFTGHSGAVTGVAWGTGADWFVSSSADGTVRVWNTADGSTRSTLTGHAGPVRCVAIDGCGACICSGGDDATIRLWEADTGSLIRVLHGHESPVRCLAVTPDGARLISGSDDQTVRIWELKSGRLLNTLAGHAKAVTGVACSPDGKRLVSGSHDRTLRVYSATDGTLLSELHGHLAEIESVAFSPDGRRIVSGGHHNEVKLWNVELGIATLTLKEQRQHVTVVRFSPDGRQLLSAGADEMIKIFAAE